MGVKDQSATVPTSELKRTLQELVGSYQELSSANSSAVRSAVQGSNEGLGEMPPGLLSEWHSTSALGKMNTTYI